MSTPVRRNTRLNQFELDTDAGIAFLRYRLSPGKITLWHTEVPAALRGRGLGAELARGALESIRQEGLELVVRCSFLQWFLQQHPEFRDLGR